MMRGSTVNRRAASNWSKTTATKGTVVRLKGTVSPYYKGRELILQRLKTGTTNDWVEKDRLTLGAPDTSLNPDRIRYAFEVQSFATTLGKHSFRAVLPAVQDVHNRAESAKTTLTVTAS